MLEAKHQLLLLEESERGQASAAQQSSSRSFQSSRCGHGRCVGGGGGDDAMTPQFSSSAGWRAGSLSLRRVAGRIIV